MTFFSNGNKCNINVINFNHEKIKINNLFLSNKFIIFIDAINFYYLKNIILNNNVLSLILRKRIIKVLFNLFSFSFLRNNNYLCIFINDLKSFINIINNLDNKQFFFLYKGNISNITTQLSILNDYNKYNKNYIYIQLIIKKIKIKIIFILIFFIISLIKYIK